MTENSPGLKFVYQKEGDILERTIGKILSIPFVHLTNGTYSSMLKDVPEERINDLKDKFKNTEWQADVEVHLNHSPLFHQLERLVELGEKDSPFQKVKRLFFGIPVSIFNSTMGKLANWNMYNPYAEVVQLFNENKYIDIAKLTTVEFIHKEKNPIYKEIYSLANSIPIVANTLLFIKTNLEAWKKLDEKEKIEGTRYLASNSATEGIMDAIVAVGLIANLGKIESIAPYVPELNTFESVALGAGIAGGISLYSEVNNRKYKDSSKYFVEDEKLGSISPETRLNLLVK